MGLLFDTMVASELRRARHPDQDPRFRSWAEATDLSDCFLSVITIHEIERGVLSTERKDPTRAMVYRIWLDNLSEAFLGRILPLTIRSARLAARFHIPDPAPLADALVAGIAQEHALTVVTRNTSDFHRFAIPVFNPWS